MIYFGESSTNSNFSDLKTKYYDTVVFNFQRPTIILKMTFLSYIGHLSHIIVGPFIVRLAIDLECLQDLWIDGGRPLALL